MLTIQTAQQEASIWLEKTQVKRLKINQCESSQDATKTRGKSSTENKKDSIGLFWKNTWQKGNR